MSNTKKITFVLVEPVVPENVGFICRSLKNMGFDQLRIVNSSAHEKRGAKNTAYKSHDILENTLHFDELSHALQDIDLVIGTTAKSRKMRTEPMEIRNLHGFLQERTFLYHHLGIVFGSESNGLSDSDQKLCHMLSTIPMAREYPSINLSHSVMLYAYELSRLIKNDAPDIDKEEISFQIVRETAEEILNKTELKSRQPELFQRALDRIIALPGADTKLFMSIARYLKRLT